PLPVWRVTLPSSPTFSQASTSCERPWRCGPAAERTSACPSEAARSAGTAGVPAAGTTGVALAWALVPGAGVGTAVGGAAQPLIQRASPPPARPEVLRKARRERRRLVLLLAVPMARSALG